MRLDQDVRDGDLAGEVGPLALMARIFVAAGVVPGPAVEGALHNPRDIVRRQIVAEAVALIGRAPDVAAVRRDRQAGSVADAAGENPSILAVGIEDEDRGATILVSPRRPDPARGLDLVD